MEQNVSDVTNIKPLINDRVTLYMKKSCLINGFDIHIEVVSDDIKIELKPIEK